MKSLHPAQAKIIVKKLMQDIPYNINIMNSSGNIIASGDESRIGEEHRAAKRAIIEERRIEVFSDTSIEKKGTNEPIFLNDTIIGVVGISGDPVEVLPFTKIVSSVVSLLIEEMNVYKLREKKKSRKKEFFGKLMNVEGSYSDSFISESLEFFGVNLLEENYCLLSRNKQIIEEISKSNEVFSSEGFYLFFTTVPFVIEAMSKEAHQQRIVYGEAKKNLKNAVESAIQTWYYADFFQLKEQVVDAKNHRYIPLFSFPIRLEEVLIKKMQTIDKETKETVLLFAKENCSYNQTSEKLHIHRNTLAYRLNKVKELTGLNPGIWYELGIILYYLAYEYVSENKRTNYLS